VGNVDDDIGNLPQAVRAFVEAEELGDLGSGCGAVFSGRDVGWKWRVVWIVFEEGPEEVDVEELKEHAWKG
jgi:hypothetical protein